MADPNTNEETITETEAPIEASEQEPEAVTLNVTEEQVDQVVAQQEAFRLAEEALRERENEDTTDMDASQLAAREEVLADMRRQKDSAELGLMGILKELLEGIGDFSFDDPIGNGILDDNALKLMDRIRGEEITPFTLNDRVNDAIESTRDDMTRGLRDREYNSQYGQKQSAIETDIDYEESLEDQIEAFYEKAEEVRDRARALNNGEVGYVFEQNAQRWEVRAARLEDELLDFRNKDAEGTLKELGRVEDGMERATARLDSVQEGIDQIQAGEGDGVALAEQMSAMQMDLAGAKAILERQRDDLENREGYADPELVSRLERLERRIERESMKTTEAPQALEEKIERLEAMINQNQSQSQNGYGLRQNTRLENQLTRLQQERDELNSGGGPSEGLLRSLESTKAKLEQSIEDNQRMDVDGRSAEATRAMSEIDEAIARIEEAQEKIAEITQDGTVNRITDRAQLEELEASLSAIEESKERIDDLQESLGQEVASRGTRSNEQEAMAALRQTGEEKQAAWDAAWEARQPQSFAEMNPTLRNAITHRGNPNNEYAAQLERDRNMEDILGSFSKLDGRSEDVGNNTDNLNPGGRGAGGDIEIT